MRLIASTRFWRDYHKLPGPMQAQVDKTLALLEENPHHSGLHTHKRQGEKEVWQARVTRSYRVYFKIEDDTVHLLTVVAHEK